MTQPKDFSPIRPSVWGLTTTWPLLQRLCEEDPQARGLLDVVVTLRIIPHSIGFSGNQKSLDWQGQLDA
jgi:hypothetical protein